MKADQSKGLETLTNKSEVYKAVQSEDLGNMIQTITEDLSEAKH